MPKQNGKKINQNKRIEENLQNELKTETEHTQEREQNINKKMRRMNTNSRDLLKNVHHSVQ